MHQHDAITGNVGHDLIIPSSTSKLPRQSLIGPRLSREDVGAFLTALATPLAWILDV